MSEYLKNNTNKQNQLKDIIKALHAGVNIKEIKKKFSEIIKNVSAEEIAEMEQALIQEGFPPEEIQKLCDVHVAVFQSSLKKQKKESKIPGHPIHTYHLENQEAKKQIKFLKGINKKLLNNADSAVFIADFRNLVNKLKEIQYHYTRKENQLFPFLEKAEFTGPSKVMWGKHDEIRKMFKDIEKNIQSQNWESVQKELKFLFITINNMIFMEEKILFPTALKKLNENIWIQIKKGETDIGYSWIKPKNVWDADMVKNINVINEKLIKTDKIKLEEGQLSNEQINLMLKNLPFDITFVDENDKVQYYTASHDRIFPRSPGIIGREVQNCHPQKSVHVVNQIVDAFKKKEKKNADFWIQMEGKLIHIRYFPVYDEKSAYKGVIEVSQDITEIQKLEGERRLLDWK